METLLDFAKGPLFRFSFSLMILGLIRILILDIWGILEAYRQAGDKEIPWRQVFANTMKWLFPVKKLGSSRPAYSITSFIFHIGLILVPLFLYAHVSLWEKGLGLAWISFGKTWADVLTVVTILAGIILFAGRIIPKGPRSLSRRQDFLWPLLILIPFVSGLLCANIDLRPAAYQWIILTHILTAEMIFILIPFTKIAHCVLMPLSQAVMLIGWRFPANTEEDLTATLGKTGEPI